MHGWGCAWQRGHGGCMAGGVHAWQGACMAGGQVWQGVCACVAGETATVADTHPTGMHSCYISNCIVLYYCSLFDVALL